eukprot:scaffold7430_cov16-Tisochrysis_lutea.AAC.1
MGASDCVCSYREAPGLPSSLIFNGAEVQFFQEHSLKHVNFFKVEDLSIITATASGNEGADGRACTAALMDTINGHHGYLTPRCLLQMGITFGVSADCWVFL